MNVSRSQKFQKFTQGALGISHSHGNRWSLHQAARMISKLATLFAASAAFLCAMPAQGERLPGFPDCPQDHCSGKDPQINAACIAAGMAGKPFPVISPDGSVCSCPCSCVAADTRILLPFQNETRIDNLRPMTMVFSPFTEGYEAKVTHMLMSEVKKAKAHTIVLDNGSQLVTSPNHTLVKGNGRINSVENLAVGDEILTADGSTSRIAEKRILTDFTGQLWNLVVASHSPKAIDHVVVTNGLQSGDYLLQTSHDRIEQEIELRLGTVEPYIAKNQN